LKGDYNISKVLCEKSVLVHFGAILSNSASYIRLLLGMCYQCPAWLRPQCFYMERHHKVEWSVDVMST